MICPVLEPLQMEGGVGGVLVQTVEECAQHVVRLMRDRKTARDLGLLGRELVREKYLLTRMMADELRLYASVLGLAEPRRRSRASLVGLAGEVRDPVCGRAVDLADAITAEYGDRTYYFHSAACRNQFLADSDLFARVDRASGPAAAAE